jgi:hypothetical protein
MPRLVRIKIGVGNGRAVKCRQSLPSTQRPSSR